MPQIAPVGGYVLTGPDGTRAVFGVPADPDFVGYLDSANGITGLLDSADVRESTDPRVEGHGFVQGNNWLGRRTGTLQGIIWPDPDMTTVNGRIAKLMRASRGLSALAPCVLTWTPDGSVQRRMVLYRQGRVTTTGQRPKQFVIPLASPDSYVYSAAEQSAVITPADGGVGGRSYPRQFPVDYVYTQVGQQYVLDQGDAPTFPRFRIDGPITNPTIRNNTTGQQFTLSYTLAAGEYLIVDAKARTVFFGTSSLGAPLNLIPNPSFEYGLQGWQAYTMTNLVTNPSFEIASAGVPTGWGGSIPYWLNSGATTTYSQVAATGARGQVGAFMGRVQTPGTAASEGMVSAALPVPVQGAFKAGRTYMVRCVLNNNGGSSPNFQAFLGPASADDASSAATGGLGAAANIYTLYALWTPTADETTVYAGIRTTSAVAADVYVDQFVVVDVTGFANPQTIPYFDGSFPGYGWNGAPNASTSTGPTALANLVNNPNLEAGIAGYSSAATGPIGNGSAVATSDPTTSHSGSASMKVVTGSAGSQGVACQMTPGFSPGCLAGQPYTMAVWLKAASGTPVVTIAMEDNLLGNGIAVQDCALSTSWQRFTVTWTPTAWSANSFLYIYTQGVAATFNVDDVIVTQTSVASAYFDGDTQGASWTGARGNSVSLLPLLTRTSKWASSGSWSGRCVAFGLNTGAAGGFITGPAVPVTAGQTYTFACQLNVSAVSPAGSGPLAYMQWLNAAGAVISAVSGSKITVGQDRSVLTATAPPGAVTAQCYVDLYLNGAYGFVDCYVDSVMFTQGAATSNYFDGDSNRHGWTGTPGNSSSGTRIDGSASSSRYNAYAANFASNSWWQLQPGNNDIRFLPFSYSTGALLTTYWRHAYE